MKIPRTISRRAFITRASFAACALGARGLFSQTAPPASAPDVQRIAAGTLRGERSNGVRIFRGVPFAQPPVGPLRFRAPVRPQPWTGERDATRFSAAPMQPDDIPVPQSEDCLYLNLWAPEGKDPFPVFVWIHGGGFTSGYAFEPVYDGAELAREGIVCITVAYRLGVFGFVDLEPLLGPGYAGSADNGVRDLIAALEWVRDNVAAFGGDPARVTVGGESAGAKLTAILMGIPSAQPLFQQMISESGGGERIYPRARTAAVAQAFGQQWRDLTGKTSQDPGTAPAERLIEAQRRLVANWPEHFPIRASIDGLLIPRFPVETIAGGSTRGKRLLIGTNRDESALFIGPHPAADPTPAQLGNLTVAAFAPIYNRYREIYPDLTDEQRRIHAVTAEEYWIPSLRVADAHCKGGGSAWMYRLDFAPASGRLRGYAYHSLDVEMVWDRPSTQVENAAAEAALARQMHLAWAAFIRGESPSAPGLPAWPEYRSDTRSTLILDTQSHVEEKPHEAELRLWDGAL